VRHSGYLDGSAAFTASFFYHHILLDGAGEFGLKRNIINKLIHIPVCVVGSSITTLYWLPQIPGHFNQWLRSRKVWFLLLWIAPAVIFYASSIWAAGLVFVFFPALVIISPRDSTACFNHAPPFYRRDCANRLFGAAVLSLPPPIRWAGTASNF